MNSSAEKRLHSFTLWFPVFVIAIVAVQLLFFKKTEITASSWTDFVMNVFFLNAVHLVSPFIILTATPRDLIKRKTKKHYNTTIFCFFGIVALMYLACLVYINGVPAPPSVKKTVADLLIWIWAVMPDFHALRQSGGIGLLLNKEIGKMNPETAIRLKQFEPKERFALNIFYGAILVRLVLACENLHISSRSRISLNTLTTAIAFLCLLWLFYSIKREEAFKNTPKLLFYLRFILWPLGAYLPLLYIWLFPIIHTQEYLDTSFRLWFSETNPSIRKRIVMISISFIVFEIALTCLSLMINLGRLKLLTYAVLPFIFALFPLISIMHYFVDGVIYRMRDPDARATIGSALLT